MTTLILYETKNVCITNNLSKKEKPAALIRAQTKKLFFPKITMFVLKRNDVVSEDVDANSGIK